MPMLFPFFATLRLNNYRGQMTDGQIGLELSFIPVEKNEKHKQNQNKIIEGDSAEGLRPRRG